MTTSGVVIAWRRPETDIVISSHVRKSKVVLDSTFNTIDSGVPGNWIPDFVSGTWIPDFKAQDSWFYKQKCLGFRIP